jgi:NDP-sugar pyrophosphorylase family protein
MSARGYSAIVLAGTYQWSGSRFESLAARPLVPVALSPLISYSLRWLRDGGVLRAVICANHASRTVEDAIGNGAELDMELRYYQDDTPRGAAGCVRDAALLTDSSTFVVADGGSIPTLDLVELLARHRSSGAAATVVVYRGGSPAAPPSPAGIYVFERRVLDLVPDAGFQDIKENLIPRLHRSGELVIASETKGVSPRVLNAQTYLAANQWMLERLVGQTENEGALIHPSAWVEPGARLVGPVQLGPRARIQSGCTIVGPTTIGPDTIVGRDAMVARSVLWSRCDVGERSVVHGCVVGNDAIVPPAARLFNVVRPPERPHPSPSLVPQRGRGKGPAPRRAIFPGPALP